MRGLTVVDNFGNNVTLESMVDGLKEATLSVCNNRPTPGAQIGVPSSHFPRPSPVSKHPSGVLTLSLLPAVRNRDLK
jgi:hypothetical protein